MTTMLDIATDWVSKGVSVIPMARREKRPDYDALKGVGSFEKRPVKTGNGTQIRDVAIWGPYKQRLPTEHELSAWFANRTPHNGNMALVVGPTVFNCVFDFDDMSTFNLWQGWASLAGGDARLASTSYTVMTSRGAQVYLMLDTPPVGYMYWKVDGKKLLEVKTNCYVMAAGSIHPSGWQYTANDLLPIQRVGDAQTIFPFPLEGGTMYKPTTYTAPTVVSSDPFSSAWQPYGRLCDRIKQHVRIIGMFPEAKMAGNWGSVRCPIHNGQSNSSFWIGTHINRCGCHAGCIPISASVIDIYAILKGISDDQAINELKLYLP